MNAYEDYANPTSVISLRDEYVFKPRPRYFKYEKVFEVIKMQVSPTSSSIFSKMRGNLKRIIIHIIVSYLYFAPVCARVIINLHVYNTIVLAYIIVTGHNMYN